MWWPLVVASGLGWIASAWSRERATGASERIGDKLLELIVGHAGLGLPAGGLLAADAHVFK